MARNLSLPLIDLSSPDRASTAKSLRHACIDHGFFYLINHGIEESTFRQVFSGSERFFSLPLADKMKLEYSSHYRGYSPLHALKLDPSAKIKGDAHESFVIGPLGGGEDDVNQWPSKESFPCWRAAMESYHNKLIVVGKKLCPLIALALNLDEQYFEKIGALQKPEGFMKLMHYPEHTDDFEGCPDEKYGISAHSDFGMITILATDGVPGLQICREKDSQAQNWEDVRHVQGAFIVNVGDLLERWTNCMFRSTLHRVVPVRQERYSVAFFFDAHRECVVEVLESCCSETSPPRFPPIRSFEYIEGRIRDVYTPKEECDYIT